VVNVLTPMLTTVTRSAAHRGRVRLHDPFTIGRRGLWEPAVHHAVTGGADHPSKNPI
jgi:hypothetical protein